MNRYTLLFAFFILVAASAPAQQRDIDIIHYAFELQLNDQTDTIEGKARISLIPAGRTSHIRLQLAGINEAQKGMKVVQMQVARGKRTIRSFSHTGNEINIGLDDILPAGDTMVLQITYKGIPADGLIISKNKYGHRTFFADNWPNRGHNWLPCADDPADKATVEFIITAPQHYQVVANGIQIEETNLAGSMKRTHWQEDVPVATKVMVIGVADFAVQLSGTVDNCIPIYSWVYPENREDGFYDYAQAAEILPFFISYAGPYGYKKLANVQSKTTFGGLENANTIFYYENSVTGNRKSEALIAHEIAHQWFGNMVTEKSFAHLWLSEGFATYMTIMYMENRYGTDTAVAMLREDRDQVAAFAKNNHRPVVDTTSNYMQLLNANSYQKGGWVLHMLRQQLGDSLFRKCIRAFYANYAGGNADTDDFRQIIEKESGRKFGAFFQQWLYTPGIPQLQIRWDYDAAAKKINLHISQLQQTPFSFPVEIAVKTGKDKLQLHKLDIREAKQSFSISCPDRPAGLLPDPHTRLLFSYEMMPR